MIRTAESCAPRATRLCATCHLPSKYDTATHHHHQPGSAGTACASCHMPTTTYMVVDPRHDHSLRVPRPDLSVTLGTPNACKNSCHTNRDARWAAAQVKTWYGHEPQGYQRFAAAFSAANARCARCAGATARDRRRRHVSPPLSAPQRWPSSRLQTANAPLGTFTEGLRDSNALVRLRRAPVACATPHSRPGCPWPRPSSPTRSKALRIEAVSVLAAVPTGRN